MIDQMEGLVFQVQWDSKTLKAEHSGIEGRLSATEEKVVKVMDDEKEEENGALDTLSVTVENAAAT